jgi:hypothetical protein
MGCRRRTLSSIVAAVSVVAVAATGCGGGGGGAPKQQQHAASKDHAATAAAADANADAAVDLGAPTPIEAFLGTSYPSEMRRRVAEVDRVRQEDMAACMRDRGWEYEPIDFSGADDLSSGAAQATNLPEDEYLARYGYGFTENLSSTSQGPVGTIHDPNIEREAKLTGANEEAYNQAKAACFEAAAKKHPDPTVIPRELREDIEELQQQIAHEPRVLDAMHRWSSCMAGAGFRFEDRDALFAELERRVAPLREAAEAAPRGQPASTLAGFDEVRRYELSVAAADVGCKADLDRVTRQVTNEVERRYVEANGDRIAVSGCGRTGCERG